MSDHEDDKEEYSSGQADLKFVSYCTGAMLDHYHGISKQIKDTLKKISDDCLFHEEGVCYYLNLTPGSSEWTPLSLPKDYASCVAMRFDVKRHLSGFHQATQYKSHNKEKEAWKRLCDIRKKMKELMTLDTHLRLLLDRRVIRATFRRPSKTRYRTLNTNAHPEQELLEGPNYSLAILWLSQLPSPDPEFNPDERFRTLSKDDQGLFTLYARKAESDTVSRYVSYYVEVKESLSTHLHDAEYTHCRRLSRLRTKHERLARGHPK